MMSSSQTNENSDIREAVEPILRVLSQLGGHFTFTGRQGEQFVIIRKDELDGMKADGAKGKQRELPLMSRRVAGVEEQAVPESADEVLDLINQDISLYTKMRQEDEALAQEILAEIEKEEPQSTLFETPLPPPTRVRFEPLRGDLPPELQE